MPSRRSAGPVVAVAVATLLIAALVLALIRMAPGPEGVGPAAAPDLGRSATMTPTAAPRVGRPAAERPRGMRLPSGADVAVVAVSTTPRGLLDVPHDVRTAGWWRGGARLGDPFGSMLVAGHVDSRSQGLGAYAELLGLEGGEEVVVRSAHLVQAFRVVSLRLVPRTSVPRHPRLWSAHGDLRLTLVTCAPPYLPERGGYQRLAVVTAVPRGATRAH